MTCHRKSNICISKLSNVTKLSNAVAIVLIALCHAICAVSVYGTLNLSLGNVSSTILFNKRSILSPFLLLGLCVQVEDK